MDKDLVTKKLTEYGFMKEDFRFAFGSCILSSAGSVLTDQLLVEELQGELPGYTFTILPNNQYLIVITF